MQDIKSKLEREALRNYIDDNIVTSKEALEILKFSRARLNQLVQMGDIVPIRSGIYLKDDIISYQNKR